MKYFNYIKVDNPKSDNTFDDLIKHINSSNNVTDIKIHSRVNGSSITTSFYTSNGTYQNELSKIQSNYGGAVLRYITDRFSDNFGEVVYTTGNQTSSFNEKCPKFTLWDAINESNLSEYKKNVYSSIGNIFANRINNK